MKGLDILAAHMLGDYILQTNEEAVGKTSSPSLLAKHVAKYCIPHAIVGLVHGRSIGRGIAYTLSIGATHAFIDHRRWASGEEWPPKPILVDQAIHSAQIALLARIL
jgi:hypothetical protein